jgi:pyruvate formate lyase activating enzyme
MTASARIKEYGNRMHVILGIKGFLGTSLIDYPGKVAAVIFLNGCNLRCPFCHNTLLVSDGVDLEDLQLTELIESLNRRKKLLDGVVVTGGEPTAHPQIAQLLRSLRTTGLSIKLDTNGLQSKILSGLVEEGLVDYVAMDLKMDPERYPEELCAPPDASQRLRASTDFLKLGKVAYEFRTTCVPGLVMEEDIRIIAQWISGASAYYLQQYRPTFVKDTQLAERPPLPREVLERYLDLVRPHVKDVGLRNI